MKGVFPIMGILRPRRYFGILSINREIFFDRESFGDLLQRKKCINRIYNVRG